MDERTDELKFTWSEFKNLWGFSDAIHFSSIGHSWNPTFRSWTVMRCYKEIVFHTSRKCDAVLIPTHYLRDAMVTQSFDQPRINLKKKEKHLFIKPKIHIKTFLDEVDDAWKGWEFHILSNLMSIVLADYRPITTCLNCLFSKSLERVL